MDLCILTEPQQGASYGDQLRIARATEELGFEGFFRSDHYLRGGDGDGLPGATDAWITLAGLARETGRIRLGTLVTPATFRLPGPLAIQVAQVDAMSGGRVELGLGAGWFAEEHSAYGIPFPEHRFALLEEQLAIVTGLWETPAGQRYSHSGAHYQFADSPALPKPVQSPRPPIIIGGRGAKRTPRLAAQFADEYNAPFQPADPVAQVAGFYAGVDAACGAIGRERGSLKRSATVVVCCGRTDAEIERRMARITAIAPPGQRAMKVTPAQLVELLEEYRAIGTQRVYLRMFDLADLDHLEVISSQVLPRVLRPSSSI
jgi:F420-dependent oxidoreductase-like protein